MNSPVPHSFQSFTPPLKGAKPVARRSRFDGFLAQARRATALALACVALTAAAQDKPWHSIGRDATPAEVKAWDIDVRPDFKGLPAGSGSVDAGANVWEDKCASCHGVFGESNEVFTPIIGGTTDDDIKTGRVKGLEEGKSIVPQKTTIMKVATVSTLFDYINRMDAWDEGAVINHFRKEDFVKNFSVAKKYLLDGIMKTLQTYEPEKSIQIDIQKLIKNARIYQNLKL